MFVATKDEHTISTENDVFEVDIISEVLTPNGYVRVKDIKIGDVVQDSTNKYEVKNIIQKENTVFLYV